MTLCLHGADCRRDSPAVDPGVLGRNGQEAEAAGWALEEELEESLDPELEDAAEPEDSEELEAAALSPEGPEDSELLERDEVELFELAESVE